MSYRNTLTKSRQQSSSKPNIKHSPYSRSIYEAEDSPPHHHQYLQVPITPQRVPIDRGEYGATRPKERLANNLNHKIDSIIKHNNTLLQQNNKLTEIIRHKDEQIHILQCRLQQQLSEQQRGLMMIQGEKNRIMLQFGQELQIKDRKIAGLYKQLQVVSQQIDLSKQEHRLTLMKLKQQFTIQSQSKFENLKRSQIYNIQVYQTQILKLKQTLTFKQQQIEQQQHHFLVKIKQLDEEVRILNSEMKHEEQKKIIQVEELKLKHENQFAQIIRKNTQQRQLENANYQNIIKRARKDLAEKTLENQRLTYRLEQTATQNTAQYGYIQQEKVKIEHQMQEMQLRNKEILVEEKNKLEQMASAQLSNLQLCHANYVNSLKSQKQKLIEINELKNVQIGRLNQEITHLKDARDTIAQEDKKFIKYLQQKLYDVEKHNQQEFELLKVKMAQLHDGDLQGIISNYENQIHNLSEQVSQLEEIIRQNRQKLHEQLVQKTQLRKQFQIQLSKQQNLNTQLKVKLQSKHIEMRQSIENIRSKHQITSQSALVQRSGNKKDIEKKQSDIKKLHQLINAKDIQINQLNDIIKKLKKDFQQENQQKNEQIERLKTINENLDNEQKKQRQFFEKQLKKKESLHKDQKERLEQDLSNIKTTTYEQLMNELHSVQKQKLRLQSELSKQKLQKQAIIKSQKTHKQIIDVMRIQSSAAIEQQRDGSSKKLSLEENKLKKFYNDQIKSKQKQIQQLKRRFYEKDSDNRDIENKVADFERKLQTMMDGQSKLREMEVRTMNLGMDNNLVKNTAQLFKNQYK